MVGFGFAAVENVFLPVRGSHQGGVGERCWDWRSCASASSGSTTAMYTGFTGLGVACSSKTETECYVSFLWCLDSSVARCPCASTMRWPRSQVWCGAGALVAAVLVRLAGGRRPLCGGRGTFFLSGNASWPTPIREVRGQVIPESEVAVLKSTFQRRMARLICSCGRRQAVVGAAALLPEGDRGSLCMAPPQPGGRGSTATPRSPRAGVQGAAAGGGSRHSVVRSSGASAANVS
jgi:hypothetical protein